MLLMFLESLWLLGFIRLWITVIEVFELPGLVRFIKYWGGDLVASWICWDVLSIIDLFCKSAIKDRTCFILKEHFMSFSRE